ncbi:MAG: hypothetical protein ACTSO9_08745 [Candidatus Helarchaeota archaeon]
MNKSARIEVINGILWTFLGILFGIWFLIPDHILETIIWWGFAVGCIISGLLMTINPLKNS